MGSQIELGLDTFGDIMDGPDGNPLTHAEVLRNVALRHQGRAAGPRHARVIGLHRQFQANASRTRRFTLPFFSTCVALTARISRVERTCVPPHGCRS